VNLLVAGTSHPLRRGRMAPFAIASITLAGSRLAGAHGTTGLWCAGCGSGRALAALATGNVPLAFRQHPLLMVGLGVLVLDLVAHLCRLGRAGPDRGHRAVGSTARSPRAVVVALVAVALVFMVLRNLPGLEVLAPLD
jgi:hypothetical protein